MGTSIIIRFDSFWAVRPKFSSARRQRMHMGNCNICVKCLSSTQALTLRKTSKFGYIQASPALAAQSSPAQPSSAQSSPVQPSPRQAPGCPSASQPASQPAAESRNSTWSQVVTTSEWRVRQARSQASHLFKDSKFLQSDCEVQLRKISRPAPSPRRTKRAPPHE